MCRVTGERRHRALHSPVGSRARKEATLLRQAAAQSEAAAGGRAGGSSSSRIRLWKDWEWEQLQSWRSGAGPEWNGECVGLSQCRLHCRVYGRVQESSSFEKIVLEL
jgi:hypothetical protein